MLKDNATAVPRVTTTMLCSTNGKFVKVNIRKEYEKPTEPFFVQVDGDEDGNIWLRNSAIGVVTAHEAEWFTAQEFKVRQINSNLYMLLEPVSEAMPTLTEFKKAKEVVYG
jgi:hypothetical protein